MAKTINYSKLSEKELLKLAKDREVEITDSTTPDQIVEALTAQDEKAKADKNAAKLSDRVVYYWLKSKAYVSDTERWAAGLYKVSEDNARLDRLPKNIVEKFEDEVDTKSLVRIAQSFHVNFEDKEDDELLAILLK